MLKFANKVLQLIAIVFLDDANSIGAIYQYVYQK